MANSSAAEGNWQATIHYLDQAESVNPNDPGISTGLGTCYLQLGRPNEAVPHFRKAVGLAPDSMDALNNLGIAFTLIGDLDEAEASFKAALQLDSNHSFAWKNLAQVYLRQDDRVVEGVQILAAVVQSNPEDNEALMLLAACYEAGGEISSAVTLYRRVLLNNPEHAEAQVEVERLEKANQDIRQIARPEHAKKLAALKGLKIKSDPKDMEITSDSSPEEKNVYLQERYSAIAFYGIPELNSYHQLSIWAKHLARKGIRTKVAAEFSEGDLNEFDIFVFSEPNLSSVLISGVNACMQAGKKYTVNLEQDFHQMPADHPAYNLFGPGNPRSLQALEIMLKDAEWVSVSSEVLAEHYRPYAKRIEVVHPTWDRDNPLWSKPAPVRNTVNIGWIGGSADRNDLLMIKDEVTRIVRENPETLFVIVGDTGAYSEFGEIPEFQKLFVPSLNAEDTPYILSQIDCLIVPLRNIPFNQAKSYQVVMDAYQKGVPWLASPTPAISAWNKGGEILDQPEMFYSSLSKAIGMRVKVNNS